MLLRIFSALSAPIAGACRSGSETQAVRARPMRVQRLFVGIGIGIGIECAEWESDASNGSAWCVVGGLIVD
jgi:hypothetical protein